MHFSMKDIVSFVFVLFSTYQFIAAPDLTNPKIVKDMKEWNGCMLIVCSHSED